MSNKEVVSVNIAILPSEEVAQRAIDICSTISNTCETNIKLSHPSAKPHINLHQTAFPERNLEAVEEIILGIVKDVSKRIKIELTKYSLFCGTGVFWDVVVNNALFDLHRKIVVETNALREGFIMDQHSAFMTQPEIPLSSLCREMLGRWGNPLTMRTFRPHLTITSLKDPYDADKVFKMLPTKTCSFEAEEVHIMDVGKNGTCPGDGRNIILPFDLA